MPNRLRILFLLLCLPALHAEELTLDQAIQFALKHNADVANALLDVAKAGERRAAVHTRLFPNMQFSMLGAQQLAPLDFTIRKGQLGDFASTGPIPKEDVKLSSPQRPVGLLQSKVAQPLSGLYKTRLNLGLLDFEKQLAAEQARFKRQDVVQRVKKVYYEIQRLDGSLQAAQETTRLYRETTRLTANYVRQQVALEADYLDVQTALARAEHDEVTLSHQRAAAMEQLNQLLGRDILTDFSVTPLERADELQIELAAARRQALERRPEIRQAQIKVAEARQDLRIKRAEYIPDINAEISSTVLVNYGSFLPASVNTVGISLTWEPFDWGRKKHELAEKRRSIEQAENVGTDARNKVLAEVNDKYRKLQEARQEFGIALLTQKAAAERLRVTSRKYQAEAVLLRTVLESQVSLKQANSGYDQTLARLWTARAEFEHSIGEDQ